MSRVLVIGAGLFGNIIATHLRSVGHTVTTLADQRECMGSIPAACLMKPSWAAAMTGGPYQDAIQLLHHHWRVHDIPFEVRPTGLTTVCQWVDPALVVRPPDILGKACGVDLGFQRLAYRRADRLHLQTEPFEVLILATGSWPLMSGPPVLQPKGGWAFLFPGQLKQRFIQPWAPYKQIVAFNRDPDHIWVGDGTALLPSSMTKERLQASLIRCASAIGAHPEAAEVLSGLRPYVKGLKEPAFIRESLPNVWTVTGGAKNGTLGAAWAARQLEQKLRVT